MTDVRLTVPGGDIPYTHICGGKTFRRSSLGPWYECTDCGEPGPRREEADEVGCDHAYRLLVSRLRDGWIGIESFASTTPLYGFRCQHCGDVQRVSLDTAVERGWVGVLDLEQSG